MEKIFRKFVSVFLCITLLLAYVPASLFRVAAAEADGLGVVVDPSTADSWQTMLGTDLDGNRYAGRVWADRSVFKNGDTVTLKGNSSFKVDLEKDEAFQVVFSVLGSSMSTTSTSSSSGPVDVVLILDTSTSMDDTSNGVTRLERVIKAANDLLEDLLSIYDVRIGIVTYNKDSETVLPLASYTNGIELVVTNYYNNNSANAGVVFAYDKDDKLLGKDDGYTQGTNLQAGIDRGFNMLANATDVQGRVPVAIVLTDGQANRASKEGYYEIANHSSQSNTSVSDASLYLSTLLNAAYNKAKVEAHYGVEQVVYGVGVDLGTSTTARVLMNPGASNGFNASSSSSTVRSAYTYFQNWAKGQNVTIGSRNGWVFDHNYNAAGVTDAKIVDNINYVDTYYDVSNADLGATFDQIYEELSSGAFNPISSTTRVDGGTGETDTPLLYVDLLSQFMEVKQIRAITLFGASYAVTKGSAYESTENGVAVTVIPYTVAPGTGANPTTNEGWNTAKHISIRVIQYADYRQKLEVEIDQQILPIILEQVESNTVGDVTTATITELLQDPLRVYYTLGVDSDILLPNGSIDASKLGDYAYVDKAKGTVTLYSSQFGVMNPAENGTVVMGDAHVGFQPSKENRYYYYQSNQGIFTDVKTTDNSPINWNASQYGVEWEEGKYELSWMSYDAYLAAKDSDEVYTYVTYFRPTASTADSANAAEEVTYLVYTNWEYLKSSVSFYDEASEKYVNYNTETNTYTLDDVGYPMTKEQIAAYVASHPRAEIYAVLGVGGMRTSRLHNMAALKQDDNGNSTNLTNTATERYSPVFLTTDADLDQHHGNDVVVWLGNNGSMTMAVDTGIALTKMVTESFGNAGDLYELVVTVPNGVSASPVVTDAAGNVVASAYRNNTLTVGVMAGQTVYITGIPAGTVCQISENIAAGADYFMADRTAQVKVPTLADVLDLGMPQFAAATVTNSPNKYGALYITKKIESDHPIPEAVANESFAVELDFGVAHAGEVYTLKALNTADTQITVNSQGKATVQIRNGQTLEVVGIPAGTQVVITEKLTQAQAKIFAAAYRTLDRSGGQEETNNDVVIPADAHSTAVVTNVYTPAATGVKLDVAGTKLFKIDSALTEEATFTFAVERWNEAAAQWEALTDAQGNAVTASVTYSVGENGDVEKTFAFTDILKGVTYTRETVDTYRILEVKGNVPGVTYDTAVHTITVTVTDVNGQLTAVVTGHHSDSVAGTNGTWTAMPHFENAYDTIEVSVDVEKVVNDTSSTQAPSKAGFTFVAVETDAQWNALAGGMQKTEISDGTGFARFTATYKEATLRYFLITEVNEGKPGWTYDSVQYRVTLEIRKDAQTGELTAATQVVAVKNGEVLSTVNYGAEAKVTFENTYAPQAVQVELNALVNKAMNSQELLEKFAGKFTFKIYKDGTAEEVRSGVNAADGTVSFGEALTFTQVGVYAYDIREVMGTVPGITYDTTIYDLVIEVTNDPATGRLVADYYFEDALGKTVTFHNTYSVTPTSYAISGNKVLADRAARSGEFAFTLSENGVVLQTAKVKADSTFAFDAISYTAAGVYTYTVEEVKGNVPGVIYTGADKPITVVITVADIDSVLTVTQVTYADKDGKALEAVVFENSYQAAPATVIFNGSKTLVGGKLEDGDFTFRLYETDSSFAVLGQPKAEASNVGNLFDFAAITLDKTGDYFFVVLEDGTAPKAGIVYDGAIHQFHVKVTDDGDGQLKASVHVISTNVVTVPAAEVTVSTAFTNATFEEVTEKTVAMNGATDTQIDGQKVNAGDVLTYYITYTNYNGQDVAVEIMDAIPAHTSYVEGSASHDGKFAADHLVWMLNVGKGQSVTVSFQVKVNETDAIIANTAVVRDGKNTYTTNQVVNHTVEEPAKKDVFNASDVTVSIDGQQVQVGDELVYTIYFTNASNQAVDVTITDVVPDHTAYVDGSASNGGEYKNGMVIWNIQQVEAWSTVVVTFRVTVGEVDAITITNVATVTLGENSYATNQVANEVPAKPAPEPTPEPDQPPKTGDNTNLSLLLALAVISGGGLAGTVTLGKKRKEEN